jgi:hypothetical protein
MEKELFFHYGNCRPIEAFFFDLSVDSSQVTKIYALKTLNLNAYADENDGRGP